MSAAAVGAQMPVQVTLDDLAAMAGADENHRYELSREGVLSVMPPADPEHALIVSRLFAWLVASGLAPEQVAVDCGIDVVGGRVPDLTVWDKGQPPRPSRSSYAGVTGLLAVIEVVSAGSEAADRVTKRVEYAKAGIPRYWVVDRDAANTVTMLELSPRTGEYEPAAAGGTRPLAWLLGSAPEF
jgi:Uma2 family endonuclease